MRFTTKWGDFVLFEMFRLRHPDKPGEFYIKRLRILETPWGGVFLQRIFCKDPRPVLHNHPYNFVSFVLWGNYWERLSYKEGDVRWITWINHKRTDEFHWVCHVNNAPVWTLLFIGPRQEEEWGFLEEDGKYTHWEDFESTEAMYDV